MLIRGTRSLDTPSSRERRALMCVARWKKTPRSDDVRIDLSSAPIKRRRGDRPWERG